MAHDVFISHSSKDKQIADAMCNKLESSGIRCWMAPRDIWPGRKWTESIVQAIGESRLMLLIFSTNANTSDHIENEVEIAARKRVPLLPFRVEDVEPSDALEYYLRKTHWLDAMTPPLEQHLDQLVESVKRYVPLPPHQIPAQQTPHVALARVTPTPAADDFPRTLKNQVGIEFVYVPPGSFMMGSETLDSEKPVHQVTIQHGFYMGKYEVTQAQWQQVMGHNPSHFKGDNLPVESVSWDDAQEFIRTLNATNDGLIYRLPSEAEWEYACRAGTNGDYGVDPDSMAWYLSNSGREYLDLPELWRTDEENYWKRIKDNTGQTHPVGQKQPNAFGLYDMHGNVWEWCQDYFHDNYAGAPRDGSAWLDGANSIDRIFRGCAWDTTAKGLRFANRSTNKANLRHNVVGLRLVAVQVPQPTTAGQQTLPASPVGETPTPAADDFLRTLKNRIGIEFVFVPPGSYMMGSENGFGNDTPVHQVTIREGFYMGKYQVTQEQWHEVMGENPSQFKGDNLPVEQVTWNDAQKFIQKLNAMNDDLLYRLPSEAEWEYACRAGTTGDYAGDLDSMAWYRNNSGDRTHPVGQKLPNAFGLFDMHGNVWELCQDYYHNDYQGAPPMAQCG